MAAIREAEDRADVVIVGAGASGAAVAWRLAEAGVNVLVLERGGWHAPAEAASTRDDWEWVLQTERHPDPAIRRAAEDIPVTADDSPIRPAFYCGVGGSTLRWGAHFPRFHPSDFKTRTLDGVGRDWPISYDDLAPYYDLNDTIMGVSGLAGDPANPPRATRPMGPFPLSDGMERLAAAFDRLGWHWWPADGAISRDADPLTGRGACNNCGPCGLGCPQKARASTDITYWPRALAKGVRLRTGALVRKIVCDRDGRATAVDWQDGTRHHRTHCDTVVLAANGMGTPRLMLASTCPSHPNGIGNANGGVGKHLMHHPTAIVAGLFDAPTGLPKGPFACALYSQEFYETDTARGASRGYQMQGLRPQGPLATALGGYAKRLPWGADHHGAFERTFGHDVSLTVTVEDLPRADNRVTLDPTHTDDAGVPAARLTYALGQNERTLLKHGIARAREALLEAGAAQVAVTPLSRQAGFHFLGTAAMGTDATAITDPTGNVNGCPGLVVVDGSLFPSAGGVNPTPTLQANALRIADHLLAHHHASLTVAA
ncbi:MAG: GMC family oxidoreductase [Pseudomonadota bacterium]